MNARRNLCYDSLAYLMYLIRCPVNEIFATISHFNVEFPEVSNNAASIYFY